MTTGSKWKELLRLAGQQKKITCCLCGDDVGRHGHNPAPLGEPPKVCCTTCNATKVITARLEWVKGEEEYESQKKQ